MTDKQRICAHRDYHGGHNVNVNGDHCVYLGVLYADFPMCSFAFLMVILGVAANSDGDGGISASTLKLTILTISKL